MIEPFVFMRRRRFPDADPALQQEPRDQPQGVLVGPLVGVHHVNLTPAGQRTPQSVQL